MPIRILFPFAGGSVLGGSHVSALHLAAGLDRGRYEPQILLHGRSGVQGDYARSLGLDIEILEGAPLMGPRRCRQPEDAGLAAFALQSLPAMLRALRRLDPAIVHTNEGRMHANWGWLARLTGRKHLWHHRQDPGAFGINRLAPLVASHIVSVSHFSKPARPLRPVDHKFSVVRSPFAFPDPAPDRGAARQALLQELGLAPQAVLLGYAGNLSRRKRPLHFVRAVQAAQAALPGRPVHGLLFGRPELPQEQLDRRCRALAQELGLAGQIHLMGFRSSIAACMAGLDALLVTALSEPFGRTLIEAMYLGTPVIATRHGGNPEAITQGRTGFLVDPEDPGAFAPPLVRLLQPDGLRQRISRAAHQEARANYGEKPHVQALSAIYDRLAAPPPGRSTGLANA